MQRLLAGLSLAVSCLVMSQTGVAAAAGTPAPFSMTITSTPHGWAARCDTGCHWTKVSFDCRIACEAIIDANGLVTAQAARAGSSVFAFRVTRSASGVRAVAERGTAWRSLSWGCRSDKCSARVDAFGVTPSWWS